MHKDFLKFTQNLLTEMRKLTNRNPLIILKMTNDKFDYRLDLTDFHNEYVLHYLYQKA